MVRSGSAEETAKGAPQEELISAAEVEEVARAMEEEAAKAMGEEQQQAVEEVVGLHVQALDEVVTVNSFFTGAVFIGLAQSNDRSLVANGPDDPCYASKHVLRQLVLLEVLAFSCFLMSTLVAQGLKLHLTLCRHRYKLRPAPAPEKSAAAAGGCSWRHFQQQKTTATGGSAALTRQRQQMGGAAAGQQFGCAHPRLMRLGVLATSLASLCGTAFLLLSIVIIVQLRLGMLSCDSAWAKLAAIPLVLLVSLGVVVFASSVYVAFRT